MAAIFQNGGHFQNGGYLSITFIILLTSMLLDCSDSRKYISLYYALKFSQGLGDSETDTLLEFDRIPIIS